MEALAAIDEELESLAEGRDLDPIVARAHEALPDTSGGLDTVDALLENLGEAVALPTIEPVGIAIPRPAIAATAPVAPADLDESKTAEVQLPEAADASSPADVEAAADAASAPAPGQSVVEMARAADAEVDDVFSDTPSDSGLSADALFGDLDEGAEPAELAGTDDSESPASPPLASSPASMPPPASRRSDGRDPGGRPRRPPHG